MATLAEAEEQLAVHFKVTPLAVKQVGLELLAHGLRTKTYRGPTSPQLGARDIVNYAIALLCRAGQREAPRVVKATAELEFSGIESWEPDDSIDIGPGQSPMQVSGEQYLSDSSSLLFRTAFKVIKEVLPLGRDFGQAFTSVLDTLANGEGGLLEDVEVTIDVLSQTAAIKAKVGNRFCVASFGRQANALWAPAPEIYMHAGLRKGMLARLASIVTPAPA
jgi:hypothetical protein